MMGRAPWLVSLVFALLACRERSGPLPASDAAGGISMRTADVPLPPVAGGPADTAVGGPPAAICLGGDPQHGEPWDVMGLDTSSFLARTSIDAMVPRDSARLAARLSRAADALPSDTTVADFRGLPVVIRSAWLLLPAPGDTLFIARAARRLPIESAPLEEQVTFLAHPVSLPTLREPLRIVWSAREVGPEESLAVRDPVAAWVSVSVLSVLFVRDADDGPRAELVERRDGEWRVTWVGVLPPCPRSR